MRRQILRIATGFFIVATQVVVCVSATPLVLTGERSGDQLGTGVACSEASLGSHRRSMIAAVAPGFASGRGAVLIYDPEAPRAKPQTLTIGAGRTECHFGKALSFIPDFNGDGVDDLALSVICDGSVPRSEVLALRSIRKDTSIRYSMCGAVPRDSAISSMSRLTASSSAASIVTLHADTSEDARIQVTMTSPRECSLTEAERRSSSASITSRAVSGPSPKCQAHVQGRLRSLTLRSLPSAKEGAGVIEVPNKSPQSQSLRFSARAVGGVGDEASGDISDGAGDATSGTSGGGRIDGGDSQVGRQASLEISPGSGGLPAPEVDQSLGQNAYVTLPPVFVALSESQKARAVKLLMNRGTSKQRAELAVENQKNFVMTYIVTVVTERPVVTAAAAVLKASAFSSRGASKIRKYRTRRDRVSIGRLRPGSTLSISYRVEIALKKPRVVLGLTKPSEAKRVRVP